MVRLWMMAILSIGSWSCSHSLFSSEGPEHVLVPTLSWPIEVVSRGHGFTEGPAIGPDGTVYFSDIEGSQILRFNPRSRTTTVWAQNSHKANGLFIEGDWMYACEAAGRMVVRHHLEEGPGSREVIAERWKGKRFGSPNDLAVFENTLVFSSFYWKGVLRKGDTAREIMDNRCYVVDLEDKSIYAFPQSFETPNGVVFDPKRKVLYLAEMKETRIYRSTVQGAQIGKPELFFDLRKIGKGRPDGMAVDPDGRLFIALYGMSDELLVLTPDSDVIGVLSTGWKTSNCAITPDGKTLYITAENQLKRVAIPLSD